MADEPKTYAAAKMTVLWDLEDCPVPDGLTPEVVCQNIKTALLDLGHNGPVAIFAYANDSSVLPVEDFDSAGIKLELIPEGSKGKAHSRHMAVEGKAGLMYALDESPSNVMVISEFFHELCLETMTGFGYNIYLAQPQNAPKYQIIRGVTRIWFWESLSVGGKPIERPATCPDCDCGRFIGDADALPEAQGEEHVCDD